jgi:hypothetical protein
MAASTLVGRLSDQLSKGANFGGMYTLASSNPKKVNDLLNRSLLDKIMSAQRYHLSTDVTTVASTYGFNVDDVQEKYLRIARPPFDTIWLEWPLWAQLEAVGVEPSGDVPKFVGVLITKDKQHKFRYIVTTVGYELNSLITKSDYEKLRGFTWISDVLMMPISWVYDTEKPIDPMEFKEDTDFFKNSIENFTNGTESGKEIDDFSFSEDLLAHTIIGGSPNVICYTDDEKITVVTPGAAVDEHTSQRLGVIMDHIDVCFTPGFGNAFKNSYEKATKEQPRLAKLFNGMMLCHVNETAGIMRFVLGALALMNTAEYVTKTVVKPGEQRQGEPTKPSRQPRYEYVTMAVPHVVVIKNIQGAQHSERHRETMRHAVSGHWKEFHKRTGRSDCSHTFVNLDDAGDRKICLLCGRRKTWTPDFERGNAELGYKQRPARIVIDPRRS